MWLGFYNYISTNQLKKALGSPYINLSKLKLVT
jgi:hypothetical protein